MRKDKYNFNSLEVGQEIEAGTDQTKVSAAACMSGKRYGKKYTTRKQDGKVFVKRVS